MNVGEPPTKTKLLVETTSASALTIFNTPPRIPVVLVVLVLLPE